MKSKSRYDWAGVASGTLPTHCEKIATYWATLIGFCPWASGKAAGQRFKAVRAFKDGLRAGGLPEDLVHQAYVDTLELARLKMRAE